MNVRSNVRPVMTGSLRAMMERQAELQFALIEDQQYREGRTRAPNPSRWSNEEKIQYLKDMILAGEDELHEAMAEMGWKPWASSRHINRDAVVSELVDTMQFIMNMLTALGATAGEVETKHYQKLRVNWQRLESKAYDGVAGKCPICKRALDDPTTKCQPGKYCQDAEGL